jgi:hypothetical protein
MHQKLFTKKKKNIPRSAIVVDDFHSLGFEGFPICPVGPSSETKTSYCTSRFQISMPHTTDFVVVVIPYVI